MNFLKRYSWIGMATIVVALWVVPSDRLQVPLYWSHAALFLVIGLFCLAFNEREKDRHSSVPLEGKELSDFQMRIFFGKLCCVIFSFAAALVFFFLRERETDIQQRQEQMLEEYKDLQKRL